MAGAVMIGVAGCTATEVDTLPMPTTARPCAFDGFDGAEITSLHYRVRTTVRDGAVRARFVRVMETAYAGYAALVPPAEADAKPLDVFLFATPAEWEAYTRRLTGRDAAVYLSVGPGGYAYGDRFVCWLFNESDLWGVAAHEGFHQYAFRHLPQRLPPALEEGLATTFENVTVTDRQVRIDRRTNARRQQGLADAARAGARLPLDDLVRLHAGDVAGRDLIVREGFYGQCWSLARLLLETPEYAAGLRRMLIDLRDGRAAPDVGRSGLENLYRPAAVRPLLTRYLSPNWPDFVKAVRDAESQRGPAADRLE